MLQEFPDDPLGWQKATEVTGAGILGKLFKRIAIQLQNRDSFWCLLSGNLAVLQGSLPFPMQQYQFRKKCLNR